MADRSVAVVRVWPQIRVFCAPSRVPACLPGWRLLMRAGGGGGAACRSARSMSSLGGSMMRTYMVSIHPSSHGAEAERDHGRVAKLDPAPAAEMSTRWCLEDRRQA